MPVTLIFAGLMILIRTGTFIALLPGLAGTPLPVMIRMGIALAVALLLAPIAGADAVLPATLLGLAGAVAAEVGVGLVMGFVGRMAFYAAEMGGRIIAMEIGLTSVPGVDAPTASNEPFASFLNRFAVLLYFLIGGHLMALGALARSFHYAPPGLATLNHGSPDMMILATARTFTAGVQLAAPFIALNFLITLAFALLGRAAPKINVFVLSFSGRSLVGLAFMGGAATLFARYLLPRIYDLPTELLSYLPVRP